MKEPFNAKRFTAFLGSPVAAKEGYLSVRFNFEVEVEESLESLLTGRNGPRYQLSVGCCTIGQGDINKANTGPSVLLDPKRKVRVFVDYEEGQLSFLRYLPKSHMYSFIVHSL